MTGTALPPQHRASPVPIKSLKPLQPNCDSWAGRNDHAGRDDGKHQMPGSFEHAPQTDLKSEVLKHVPETVSLKAANADQGR